MSCQHSRHYGLSLRKSTSISIPESLRQQRLYRNTITSTDHCSYGKMDRLFKRWRSERCSLSMRYRLLVSCISTNYNQLTTTIDDAILERLNSVLEPHRLLVLAEKVCCIIYNRQLSRYQATMSCLLTFNKGNTEIEELIGHENFRILATMNPGGDFGKKELSPAMRNRFTEIWVPSISGTEELVRNINNWVY